VAKVIIVDDANFMRMALKNILEKYQHEVVAEGKTGKEAIELYRRYKPDLMILDITMPEMDGMEALKIIKKEFPDAIIVMCSAMGQQKMVVEAIEAGAKDFIVKPFEENRIQNTINRLLN